MWNVCSTKAAAFRESAAQNKSVVCNRATTKREHKPPKSQKRFTDDPIRLCAHRASAVYLVFRPPSACPRVRTRMGVLQPSLLMPPITPIINSVRPWFKKSSPENSTIRYEKRFSFKSVASASTTSTNTSGTTVPFPFLSYHEHAGNSLEHL